MTTVLGGQNSSARLPRPPDFWLRHVFPERFRCQSADLMLDDVQLRMEELTGRVARAISLMQGPAPAEANNMAVNLLVREALALQRDRSPEGYRSMVASLIMADPLFGDLRRQMCELNQQAVRSARSMAFCTGISASILVFAVSFVVAKLF